jgi:AraC-like DNA-binding protein
VRILELFARYISNSWKRLQLMSEAQRKQDRELALDRKELASILLSGESGNHQELKDLARRAGLQRIPDRVLVLQIECLAAETAQTTSPTLNRISHMVEDLCQTLPNSLATVVRPGEVCVFLSQELRNRRHQRLTLQEIAEGIVSKVRGHCHVNVRVGISEEHGRPAELLRAYQEACFALDTGGTSVLFFSDPQPQKAQVSEVMTRLLKAFRQGANISSALRGFLALAMPADHSIGEVQQSRALLTWAIEHISLETVTSGIDAAKLKAAKEQATTSVLHAPSPFAACEAFRRFSDAVSQQMASAFSQREQKIILAVSRLVEERGAAQITIQDLADAVHLSCGHLSRVFRKTTGTTLEQYLIEQRVELAKRALLDPRLNVAEVAERCGFCNPAYFASVFKKHVKCTPREFASQPHRWQPVLGWPLLSMTPPQVARQSGDLNPTNPS